MTPDEPILRPPGTLATRQDTAGSRRYWVWLALTLVLTLALAVVFYLPSAMVPGDSTPAIVDRLPSAAPTDLGSDNVEEGGRAAAEAVLREYLSQYARLELDGASRWGEPEWSKAAQAAKLGDRLFGQNDYGDAREAYARGFDLLLNLEASRAQRLAAALADGQQALAHDQAESAIEQFELALAMAPEHDLALAGLAQARVRNEVLALLQNGLDAENQGELEAARQAYLQASQLDGAYLPAAQALRRVTKVIDDERFHALLGQAMRALDAQRYGESRKALAEAARLKPDDVSLRDLRERLQAGQQRSALAALRHQARARTANEDWQAAAKLYEKALALEPNAAFAEDGRRRARDRIRLHEQIDHYLADPTRLYSDEPLANAEQLLAAAGQAPADEPQLSNKLARLRGQVVRARTPVLVDLRSDGQTEVTIYHVGRRGRFLQQQLELRPGTYTALGSRSGYRDVRKVFEVRPGATWPKVVIQCEERL
jgi:hypothetical protein